MRPFWNFFKRKKQERKLVNKTSQSLLEANALLQELVDAEKVPGMAVVVQHKTKQLFYKGYGYATIDTQHKVVPNKTVFRTASVAKPIAASLLLLLEERGEIDLDASFYKYVPEYPKKEYDFTIRQLATHTAGIRGYRGKEYGLNEPYSIEESVVLFKSDPLLFKPGTDYAYTSFGWVLLSLAIERIMKQPFLKLLQTYVLEPNELKHVFADTPHAKITETATFYTKRRGEFKPAIPVNNTYKIAAGGLLATATDLVAFGQAFLTGLIGTKESRLAYTTSHKIKTRETYYGIGWEASEDDFGRKFYGHTGNGVGGYANFYVYPEQELVVTILINCTNPNVQPQLNKVIAKFHEAVAS